MAARLSCPVCRVDLPEGGTHCPRCGLRVAPLPRRPRPGRPEGAGRPPRRPALAGTPRAAALQGAAGGGAIVAVLAAVGIAVAAAGGQGRALAGDVLFACVALLVVAAAVMPGVHASRWAAPDVLRARAAAAHRVDPRRAAVLGAAAACAAGLLLAAVLPW
ncbi:MAG TPA: hypothetical protein VFO60_05695 [Candidatus Dormibacteraeota bacterium]|nr:hypothetical protein [Candidatus Dormibacteraeota bacterium]